MTTKFPEIAKHWRDAPLAVTYNGPRWDVTKSVAMPNRFRHTLTMSVEIHQGHHKVSFEGLTGLLNLRLDEYRSEDFQESSFVCTGLKSKQFIEDIDH